MSNTALVSLLALAVLLCTATAVPCNSADTICLSPLKRHHGTAPLIRRGGGRGSSGGSRGSSGRRPSRIPAVITGGRRPGRGSGDDSDDDDDDDDDDNVEGTDGDEDDDDDDDDDDDEACFPANAKVQVQGLGTVPMHHLKLGDRVLVSAGVYSQVFFFGHKVATGGFQFVRVHTAHGTVALSAGHYIYVNGRLVAASTIRQGDVLENSDGLSSPVTKVEHVVETGLYNPHTLHGDIVVDGFRSSSYTRTVDISVAQSLLAPVRAVFRLFGVDPTGSLLHHASPPMIAKSRFRGNAITGTT